MSDNGTTTIDRTTAEPHMFSGLELITGIIGCPPFPPTDAVSILTTIIHTSVRQDLVLARFADEAGRREVISDRLALLTAQGHMTAEEAQAVNSTVVGDTDAAGSFDAGLPVLNADGGRALGHVLAAIATRPRAAGVDFSAAGDYTILMAGIGGAVVGGLCYGGVGAVIGAETAAGVAASCVE